MKSSIAFVLVLLFFTLSHPASANYIGWNGLGTVDYDYRFARTQCCDGPDCQDSDPGNVSCSSGICSTGVSVLHDTPQNDVFISGHGMYCPPYVDYCPGAEGQAGMTRTSPEALSVEYKLVWGASDPPIVPTLHVAVFRYAGDPGVFDGLEIHSVTALVSMGIISDGDVLFSDFLDMQAGTIEHVLDVTGIPQSELVLLAVGKGLVPTDCPGPPAVPATGGPGLAALGMAMLAALAIGLRRAARGRA